MKKNKTSKGKKLFIKKEKEVGENKESEVLPGQEDTEIETDNIQNEETGSIKKTAKKDLKPTRAGRPEPDKLEADGQEAFADDNTILVKRTVRSGQSIRFDGNVVVMGDVNPGSEIVAAGNIVVMGALRGVVHAGAMGNELATVAAFKLQPTQLRIANHITRAPDGDYLAPEYPEIARIKNGVVVIEVYQMGQDRQTKIG